MIHVPWKERYSIRYQRVDQQHKELLAILNQLAGLVGKGADAEQVAGLFSRLCQYAMEHFSAEERFLQASGYDRLAQQQAEHAFFINRVLELDRDYDPSDPALVDATMTFLKGWFVEHIMRSDQDYADWMRSFYRRAKIRGVLFDSGGVLAGPDPGLTASRLAALCGLGPEELGGRLQAEASLFSDFECGAVTPEQFLEEVSRLCGHPLAEAELIPVFTDSFTPIPSARELLRRLKPRCRLGLIANANPWQFARGIRTSEVFPLFDAVTASFRVKALKPDPRVFQDALDQLELLAEECVFIDASAACAEAASGCLLHGIQDRGPQALLRDLGRFGILS